MARITVGDQVVDDAHIMHDSAREIYRSPLGALPAGTEVRLALEFRDLEVEGATLCVKRDDSDEVARVEMFWEDGKLQSRYVLDSAQCGGGGLFWYWFEVVLPGGAVFFYGSQPPYPTGLGQVSQDLAPAFQLTVYAPDFETPDWAKSAIMYQIFPDRFRMGDPESVGAGVAYHHGKGRADIMLHEDWDELPLYEARPGQLAYTPSDMFGGDLEGICQRLSYLQSLGVTLIYLNPIFESDSNHRYNTGDYLKVDPILGSAEDLRRLCAEARGRGIRIILDGVFSHTGDDSRYFNKYGRYDELGACQSTDSPYFSWYEFSEFPDHYRSWWGFDTLPEVNEGDPGWRDFVISGENSVMRHWLREGAAGYRLDVADELPDDTIACMRAAIKETDPASFLLGEVWEDATQKEAYGRRRDYALGRGLDSVMNYPFLKRTLEFVKGTINADLYRRFLLHQQQAYPPPLYYTLMNLLSSHDVCRQRSVLAADVDADALSRADQAQFRLSEEDYALAGRRQRLTAALQYALPGMPAIYYGDEVGMTGLLDPFNRRTWTVEDEHMGRWYEELGRLRNSRPAMSTGYASFLSLNSCVAGILRYTVDGRDRFGRVTGADAVLTLVNPTDAEQHVVINLSAAVEGEADLLRKLTIARSLTAEAEVPLEAGQLGITLEPCSAEIFELR
ncbi:MAG: glycoside hydrolase family 13 protein [Actinomycetia bacterium]|nr:glycoside hydrolase family 13 protein [Actinomycetes bacterium]